MREVLEDARERWFWRLVLRTTWTVLVLAAASGALVALAVLRGSGHLALGAVGLAAGGCLAFGTAGSALGRRLAALALGGITLPLWAAHLAAVSVRGAGEPMAEVARLAPFLGCAAGALIAGVAVARMWRGLPARPAEEDEPGRAEDGAAREGAARAAQEVST